MDRLKYKISILRQILNFEGVQSRQFVQEAEKVIKLKVDIQ